MHLIELTSLEDVNKIILNEHIQDDISDDPTKGFAIQSLQNHEWIGVVDDDQIQGLFLLVSQNSISVEIHTCLLPSLRGIKAIEAGKLILNLIFQKYEKVISWIPENNRKAKLMSYRLGFEVEGINRASFLKNGKLHDQFLVGLTKGEFLCQQAQQ
ncbi:GNAT family N-acetyltransferase [Acinetobacter dispersus]|uniref:GNAT family N-acetyltransferase n=1 Tax=Acinetobacter dispersus TaxID=70348 RepID=UPI001F4BA70E|nr:GNAT family N-acetyltransferase [Acinetobacter dispersus]MCH7391815.1 GNAT family N-acetyltransferase [Acinetobacter dispersus]